MGRLAVIVEPFLTVTDSVGNTHCPACNANFDYDPVDKKLKLLECDRVRFPRANPLLGQSHDLQIWSLFSAGKNSLSPGWFCSTCQAEFDNGGTGMRPFGGAPRFGVYEIADARWVAENYSHEPGPPRSGVYEFRDAQGAPEGMKLIGGPTRFASSVGKTLSFENWHRLAKGLPSGQDEAQLKTELNRLQAEADQERARLANAEQQRRAAIQKQIEELAKQSFIGGFIMLELQTKTIGLRKDERVAWESAACRLKQRSTNGVPYWDTDGVGKLIVTDQRVIFRADTGAMWSKPVGKLLSANHEYIRDQGICVLWIDGQQKPIGFTGIMASGMVSIGNNMWPLALTSHDLREVLQSRCGG